MPYLNTYEPGDYWAGVEIAHAVFDVSTSTVVSNSKCSPGITAVKASTGVVTVTFDNAPYYQCVGAHPSVIEASPSAAGQRVSASLPTDASGTTSTATFYAGAAESTPANPASACTVSILYFFRKIPVP